MNFKIPNNIQQVLDILHKNHFEAYLVGGCVRDFLMNINPKDYDITTNALPNQIKEVFKDYKLINNNGEKHGTITVFINEPIEITTYRSESEYLDHRHPSKLEFSDSLYQDLSRRDFTMNAIAYDGKILVDPFNGIQDINNRIIKCVGNPNLRFEEDALRILRAIRFAAKYNYTIELNTLEAMSIQAYSLTYLSKERIKSELDKMIIYEGFIPLFKSYDIIYILTHIIPELKRIINFDQKSKYHKHDLWYHTASVIENVPANSILKLSALFHDIGKVTKYTEEVDSDGIIRRHFINHAEESYMITKNILESLKYSNEEKEKILFLVRYHDFAFSKSHIKRSINKLLQILPSKYRDELFYMLIDIRKADRVDHIYYEPVIDLDKVIEAYNIAVNTGLVYSRNQLKINGNDILNLGLKGPIIKEILNDCLNKIINDELTNDKNLLLNYIKSKYIIN